MKREYVKELQKQAYAPKAYSKVVSRGLDDTWSIDLVDMRYIDGRENEKNQLALNDGYQYIFMCIDLFSRYGWAVPMKDKTTKEAWNAFSKILESGRKPKKIWADQGGEFHSDFWEDKLTAIDVTLYYTGSERKAVMVERLNKTIKTWLWQMNNVNKSYDDFNCCKLVLTQTQWKEMKWWIEDNASYAFEWEDDKNTGLTADEDKDAFIEMNKSIIWEADSYLAQNEMNVVVYSSWF